MPHGLTPQAPTLGPFALTYRAPDGTIALRLLEGPVGCCIDQDPRKVGQIVRLPHGIAAHFLANPAQYGGPVLWWHQEGAFIALSGPHLTLHDEATIAASMSRTADLTSGNQ